MSFIFILAILFLLLHPLIGVVTRISGESALGFVTAHRAATPLLVGVSLVATILGASSVMGVSGLAAKHGVTAGVWLLAGAMGLFLLSALVGKLDLQRAHSLPDVFKQAGQPRLAKLAGGLIAPAWIGILAAQFAAAGTIFQALHPDGYAIGIGVFASAVFLYVMLAGQKGILRTDFVQAFFLIGFLLVLLLGLLLWPPSSAIAPPQRFQPLPLQSILEIALVVGFPFLVGPDIYSRLLTLNQSAKQKKALRFAGVFMIFAALLIVTIGILGAKSLPSEASEGLLVRLPEAIFGQWGLLVASIALLATLLSSADSCLLSVATIVSFDLLEKKRKRFLVFSLAIFALSAAFVALWSGGIIKTLLLAYTIYSCGLFVSAIFVLFFRKKPKAVSLGVSILTGGAFGLIGKLMEIPFSFFLSVTLSFALFMLAELIAKRLRA